MLTQYPKGIPNDFSINFSNEDRGIFFFNFIRTKRITFCLPFKKYERQHQEPPWTTVVLGSCDMLRLVVKKKREGRRANAIMSSFSGDEG
jgi:hypothetical protein